MTALYVAPLWPAGHLPHKGGDWQLRPHSLIGDARDCLKQRRRLISPLVGEMAGRPEGGAKELIVSNFPNYMGFQPRK